MSKITPSPAPRPSYRDALSVASTGVSSTGMIEKILHSAEHSKSHQVARMIFVIMIPVVALIAKTSISFVEALQIRWTAAELREVIDHALVSSSGIHLLQAERGLTAVYLATETPQFASYKAMANARLDSNQFLLSHYLNNPIQLVRWRRTIHTGLDALYYLDSIRAQVDGRKNVTVRSVIESYSALHSQLISDSLRVSKVPSRADIWPLVVAFGAVSRAIDNEGIQRALGGAAFAACTLNPMDRFDFSALSHTGRKLLDTAIQYHPPIRLVLDHLEENRSELLNQLERLKSTVINQTALAAACDEPEQNAARWFGVISEYLKVLSDIERDITKVIRDRIPVVENEALTGMVVYLLVMIIVSIVSIIISVWYSFKLNNLSRKMQRFARTMLMRTEEVKEEKRKTDYLLYQMMPKKVAESLKTGAEVPPEWYDSVTIYFSDIVGWATNITTKSTPHQLISLLNKLYGAFDDIIEKYDVYKVETIADSYMCVSGLPERNGNQHVAEIGQLALEMNKFAKTFIIDHLPGSCLNLRIGFHSGPCVAGIVGTKMPRYCLFGDTVNTAARMETNGQALKIHMSESSKKLIEKMGGFDVECRGKIPIKGKGEMTTYWLVSSSRVATSSKRVTIHHDNNDVTFIPDSKPL